MDGQSVKPREQLRTAYNALLSVRPLLMAQEQEKCNLALAIVCELTKGPWNEQESK